MQTMTFALSMIVQAVALGLSIYALVDAGTTKPPLLSSILILELVVQGVELLWYMVVGALYYFGRNNIGVEYRYWDWVVTTPTMLISVLLFLWYLKCNLFTIENIFADTTKIVYLSVSVGLNWVMLAMGYVYEAKMERVTNILDSVLGTGTGLWLGFVPFIGSYVPIFLAMVDSKDAVAYFVAILTFCIWFLYGVVALLYSKPGDALLKNTFYNLLDIVSKNLAGISVAIVTLMYTSTPLDTTVALCNATST